GWLYTPTYRAIETSSKKEKIHVLNNVDDNRELAKIYQHAKLFVYPSFYEGFGLPVIEAMACKTPVITTDVSSLPEVAKDGALYVKPNDISSLAGLISTSLLCPSPDRIDKAFEISQQYTWAKAAAQVLAIYNL
ncbi:MAG: glycosyltransferase family 4 protein, partial [Bacteroidetes bacterium]|nr:glycosyltransferase family 4 protein [Bacteroidota bacterium]